MENVLSLKEFLDEYGENMAEKVTEELEVIHDPLREREEKLEGVLLGMTKKPFPSQGEIIKACYKSLTTGNKAVYMVCEMGTGKTLMAIAVALMLHRLKGTHRVLVVCPPHLVPKGLRIINMNKLGNCIAGYCVIPIAMKPFGLDFDLCKVLVRNLDSGFVLLLAQLGFDIETRFGRCAPYEIYNDLVADQRPPTPILCNEGKQPVLNLVPLAGSRREMRYAHLQGRFIGKALYAELPQTGSRPVAASAVGQDQKLLRLRVGLTSHSLPPAQNRIYGEIGSIVVGPNRYPALVLGNVIHPVRDYLAQFLILKIMDSYFFRLVLGLPFRAVVLEVSDQFLFLRINGDNRLTALLKSLGQIIDILKLGVSVRVRASFSRLRIGLQAVVKVMKQIRNLSIPNSMPLPVEFFGQFPGALAGPAQGRLRISTSQGFYEQLQVPFQRGIKGFQGLSSTARSSHSAALFEQSHGGPVSQLIDASHNGRTGEPCYGCHYAHSPICQ